MFIMNHVTFCVIHHTKHNISLLKLMFMPVSAHIHCRISPHNWLTLLQSKKRCKLSQEVLQNSQVLEST